HAPAAAEIYTLSLHDALPISGAGEADGQADAAVAAAAAAGLVDEDGALRRLGGLGLHAGGPAQHAVRELHGVELDGHLMGVVGVVPVPGVPGVVLLPGVAHRPAGAGRLCGGRLVGAG